MADLIEVLRGDGPGFSFFQTVSLLREYLLKKGGLRPGMRENRLRFSPHQSIAFPQSDVIGVETAGGDTVHLFLSFMGLIGVSSPLPNYFSDYIARHPEQADALIDFCDMFNHRVYALFHEAFSKYRFTTAAGSAAFLMKLDCLAGKPRAMAGGAHRLIAYAGVLATRRRSARGLETVIADYFGGIPVTVQQFFPRWAPIANPTRLGADAALGVNTTVGTEVYDLAGKFRVVVGPLHREAFERFVDGTRQADLLRCLVGAYVADPLAFDIEVRLSAADLVPVILGETAARLGQTSSLGRSKHGGSGGAYAVVLAGCE